MTFDQQFKEIFEADTPERSPVDISCCYFGWNGRNECNAVTKDGANEGWYMALDPTTEHADAVFVCPNHVNCYPLTNYERLVSDVELLEL